jgi:acylphosphatase
MSWPDEPRVRAHVIVRGIVQGVYYRSTTGREARALGLAGWVRNMADGSVEAVFEGPRTTVERMIEWCRTGPPRAVVDDVEIEWLPAEGEQSFRARY